MLIALALPAAALTIATLEALYRVLCVIMPALLAPRAAAGGPVRELLAESLGDRTVSVAYWLPDRERFVDEHGRPVTLPEPGSGRAWTAVERDGRRVAAIIHDASLDTSRELVEAAAAASSLAIDNERLKADLQARVEELRVSRLRIMEAGDLARRRIERNLHDGAQQQLVALALELRVLKARVKDPDAVPLIDELSERLATALAELRELARGIHPAILTDRGLAPAIGALAERGAVPIECDVAVTGAAAGAGRGGRVLPGRRGADERRPVRARVERARGGAARRGCAGGPGRRRRRRRRRSRGRLRPARARRPRRGRRRDAGDRQPGRRRDDAAREDSRYEAAAGALRAAARRVRRDDGRARGRASRSRARRPPRPWRARRLPDDAVRIAVVTHGPASSKFWAIIRNGVDSAARRLDVLVDYQSPDVYSLERMSALIDQAVATKPDGLVVSIPEPGSRRRSAAR